MGTATGIFTFLAVLVAAWALFVSARQNQISFFKSIIEEIGSETIQEIRGKLNNIEPDSRITFSDARKICVAYDRTAFYILSHGRIPFFGKYMFTLFDELHRDSIVQFGPTLYRLLIFVRRKRDNLTYCSSLERLLRDKYKIEPVSYVLVDGIWETGDDRPAVPMEQWRG